MYISVTISLVIMVLTGFALKSYATRPRVLELRELSQRKASPGDAVRVVGL